jgi:hypothetical protein
MYKILEERLVADFFLNNLSGVKGLQKTSQTPADYKYESEAVFRLAEKHFFGFKKINPAFIEQSSFISQELRLHPEYFIGKGSSNENVNYMHLNLLADKLYLFSLLTGTSMLKLDFPLKNSYISSDKPDSLKLLASKGRDRFLWNSEELFQISDRRNKALKFAKKEGIEGMGSYLFHLEEVLQAPAVQKLFGPINYKDNVSTKNEKNYLPLSDPNSKVYRELDYISPFEPQMSGYVYRTRNNRAVKHD